MKKNLFQIIAIIISAIVIIINIPLLYANGKILRIWFGFNNDPKYMILMFGGAVVAAIAGVTGIIFRNKPKFYIVPGSLGIASGVMQIIYQIIASETVKSMLGFSNFIDICGGIVVPLCYGALFVFLYIVNYRMSKSS